MDSVDPTRINAIFDPTRRWMEGVATHGHTYFKCPIVSHVEGNLWQGGCENGLILPTNIEHLLSLYKWEQYEVTHELKSSRTVTMYDSHGTQDALNELDEISDYAVECVKDGVTLIHCQAGLNRSGLLAGITLVKLGHTPEDALKLLRDQRSSAVLCNKSFEKILLEWK